MDKDIVKKYKEDADKKKLDDSRDRLSKIATKKIMTTMIGSLEVIENYFGFLWQPDSNGKISKEAIQMRQLYDIVREEILDKGNTQIRNLEKELEYYDVEWKRYRYDFPVKKMSEQQLNNVRNWYANRGEQK